MIFPVLSVTVIGAIVGAIMGRHDLPAGFGRGVVAAWFGFLVGAFPGVLIDVVIRTGWWVGVLGHAGALLAAVASFAVRRADPTS